MVKRQFFSDYFERELARLRELGSEFASQHPGIAPVLAGPVRILTWSGCWKVSHS